MQNSTWHGAFPPALSPSSHSWRSASASRASMPWPLTLPLPALLTLALQLSVDGRSGKEPSDLRAHIAPNASGTAGGAATGHEGPRSGRGLSSEFGDLPFVRPHANWPSEPKPHLGLGYPQPGRCLIQGRSEHSTAVPRGRGPSGSRLRPLRTPYNSSC